MLLTSKEQIGEAELGVAPALVELRELREEQSLELFDKVCRQLRMRDSEKPTFTEEDRNTLSAFFTAMVLPPLPT